MSHTFNVQVEVDPTKADADDIDVNTYSLLLYCQKVLVAILKSGYYFPEDLRKFFFMLYEEVDPIFPGYANIAIGGFVFLRFLCSAITVPDTYGLTPKPPSQAARRNLILVAKVLQNVANEVTFGKKEEYMVKMNDFITVNIPKLYGFYKELLEPAKIITQVEVPEITPVVINNSIITIHNQIIRSQSKIKKYNGYT